MIKTARLVLKQLSRSDEKPMTELLTNDIIKATFMIPDFASQQEVQSAFEALRKQSLSENHYILGIYLNNQLIGFVNDVETDNDKIEIGYAIHPDYHNKGYATEALGVVIGDLFSKGYSEIVAGAFDDNQASLHIMEKCGMEQTDKVDFIDYHGKKHRCVYRSIKK